MGVFAISLVLSSTVLHAGWNLLARQQRDEEVFFLRMLVVLALAGLVPALGSELVVRSLPPRAWACAVASGVCCGFYYLGLARAYASTDFTVVYPVVRSLPVLLVGIGDALGGRAPSTLGWAGLAMVAVGGLLAPQRSFRDISLRCYWHRRHLWLLLAALGTVGYSVLDNLAAEVVHRGPAAAARYGYVFFTVSLAAYAVARKWKCGRPAKTAVAAGNWWLPAVAAMLNFGAYWLVLWAYQLVTRAGYVVAGRQFSIVLGVGVGFAMFGERGLAVRLTGVLLITGGLVLIALCGA